MSTSPFHYAFKVKDLESTRRFYIEVLGCREGRSTDRWIDFDFFGHQLSAHESESVPDPDFCGNVDGVAVPMPHFGCLLPPDKFSDLAGRLNENEINFLIPPQTRYAGQVGEQQIMFVLDPSGNALEFKSFKNPDEVFGL
jgi:extradiol dioxygenase family protein